jgi:hypothetical protein
VKCGNAGCQRTADRLVYLAVAAEAAYPACDGCVRYLSPEELPATVAVVKVVFMEDVDRETMDLTLAVMDEIELAAEWRPGLRTYSDPG